MKKRKEKENKTNEKKGIILILSGGNARGLAHIGFLEVLKEHNIPIKRIIGTSAGALVGGFYAAGKLENLKNIFLNMSKFEMFNLVFSPFNNTLWNDAKVDFILKKELGNRKIEKLDTPFTAVVFDTKKNEVVALDKLRLFDALRAAIAIPGFLVPHKVGNTTLIDAGFVDVIPIDIAKRYGDKDKIVVVNLEEESVSLGERGLSIIHSLYYNFSLALRTLSKSQQKQADLVIEPDLKASKFQYTNIDKIIKQGRKIGEKSIPKIKKLLKEK